MASYYDFFCQTKTRVAATAVGVVSAATYCVFLAMAVQQSNRLDKDYNDCLSQNNTQHGGRALWEPMPSSDSFDDPCVEPCVQSCHDAADAHGTVADLMAFGVLGLVVAVGLLTPVAAVATKVKRAVEMYVMPSDEQKSLVDAVESGSYGTQAAAENLAEGDKARACCFNC